MRAAAARGCALALMAASLGVAGCAGTPALAPAAPTPGSGDATWHSVTPSGTPHYQLAVGEIASGSNLQQEVAPAYPKGMLLSCPPRVQVPALVVVGGDGTVSDVRVDQAVAADPARQPFADAVRIAVRQWHFYPLMISHVVAEASGATHVADSETKPFSLSYVFDFSCHGGKGSSTTHKVVASSR